MVDDADRLRRYHPPQITPGELDWIIDDTPFGIAFIHIDGRIRHGNAALQRMIGYSETDLRDRSFFELMPAEDQPTIRDVFQELLNGRQRNDRVETRFVSQEGETMWAQLSASAVQDAQGNVDHVVGVVVEGINEQNQTLETLRQNEANFRMLAEMAPVGILIHDGERFHYGNPEISRITGYSRDELYQLKLGDVVHPDDRSVAEARARQLAQGQLEEPGHSEYKFLTKDGQQRWINVAAHQFESSDQHAVLAIVQDVTDRKQYEGALRQSEAKYRALFEQSKDAVYIVDQDGRRMVDVNQRFVDLFGYTRDELIGMDVSKMFFSDTNDFHRFRQEFRRWGSVKDFEVTLLSKDGQPMDCLVTYTPLWGGDGHRSCYQGLVRDVTERRRLQERLSYLTYRDPHTGLFNRLRFEQELEWQLTPRQGQHPEGALLWVDLDRFAEMRGMLGQQGSDELISDVAVLLDKTVQEGDVIARLAQDEFGVLCPYATRKQAETVARNVLQAIHESTLNIVGEPIQVTASLGVSCFPDHGSTSAEVMANADRAKNRAKAEGRNRWCVYTPEPAEQHEHHVSMVKLVQRVRKALDADDFTLYAQRVYDLQHDLVHGGELLLRLTDDDTPISPGAFMEAAERFGLMEEVDGWVVREALRQAAHYHQAGSSLCFEINLSGQSVGSAALLDRIEASIGETGVDPACVTFEITETAAITQLPDAEQFIDKLKQLGCKFALDDFGVGYSSFYHLKRLPVDYLKIDGSFVRRLAEDTIDRNIVRAMVEIAHSTGKATIAEFVEDKAVFELLKDDGVDYAQGYYVNRPQPLAECFPISTI